MQIVTQDNTVPTASNVVSSAVVASTKDKLYDNLESAPPMPPNKVQEIIGTDIPFANWGYANGWSAPIVVQRLIEFNSHPTCLSDEFLFSLMGACDYIVPIDCDETTPLERRVRHISTMRAEDRGEDKFLRMMDSDESDVDFILRCSMSYASVATSTFDIDDYVEHMLLNHLWYYRKTEGSLILSQNDEIRADEAGRRTVYDVGEAPLQTRPNEDPFSTPIRKLTTDHFANVIVAKFRNELTQDQFDIISGVLHYFQYGDISDWGVNEQALLKEMCGTNPTFQTYIQDYGEADIYFILQLLVSCQRRLKKLMSHYWTKLWKARNVSDPIKFKFPPDNSGDLRLIEEHLANIPSMKTIGACNYTHDVIKGRFPEYLRDEDIDRFSPGSWLNDVGINVVLRMVSLRAAAAKENIMFLTTRDLSGYIMGKRYSCLRTNYFGRRSSSTKKSFLEYDMLVLPVHNSENHWYIAVVVHPGDVNDGNAL